MGASAGVWAWAGLGSGLPTPKRETCVPMSLDRRRSISIAVKGFLLVVLWCDCVLMV